MEKKAKKKRRTKADPGILLEPIVKLKMDLRTAAATLKHDEARYLVDLYYQIQDFRKASNSQIGAVERAVAKGKRPDEPTLLLGWIFNTNMAVEQIIKKTLEEFTEVEPSGMGVWAKSVFGIGPVLSAGLLAHIDITKVKTAGGIWRFAGLDFTSKWEKKHKRPWNAKLKELCWKIGESFVINNKKEECFYGHLYLERKEIEARKNDNGDYKDQAAVGMARVGNDTEAIKYYRKGLLPPGHLHSRARRWAVKIFLAHWFEEAFKKMYKKEPPLPYALAHLNHTHRIESPQASPGWSEHPESRSA